MSKWKPDCHQNGNFRDEALHTSKMKDGYLNLIFTLGLLHGLLRREGPVGVERELENQSKGWVVSRLEGVEAFEIVKEYFDIILSYEVSPSILKELYFSVGKNGVPLDPVRTVIEYFLLAMQYGYDVVPCMEAARLAVPYEFRPSAASARNSYSELEAYRFKHDPSLIRFEVDEGVIAGAIQKAKGAGTPTSTLRKTLLLSDEDLEKVLEKIGLAYDLAVFLKSLNLENEVERAIFHRVAKLLPQKKVMPVTMHFNSSRCEASRSESFQKWESALEVLGFTRSVKRKAV